MREATLKAKGARRCTNPACESGGRWIVRGMTRLKNDKCLLHGEGLPHRLRGARDVIDPANDDYRLYVGLP